MASKATGFIPNSTLLQIDAGILGSGDACVVIVKTEWNAAIVDELEKGCITELENAGVKTIILITVPGAVEIPFAIKRSWDTSSEKKRPDAYIALGCVIKGDTPHFDYVCESVNNGIQQLNLLLPVPCIFGVLTVNTDLQAQERIGGSHGHKGSEAAITALKMIALNRSFQK